MPPPSSAPVPSVTPTDGVLDATALRRLWPDVLEAVKRSSRRTRALLDNAQVSHVDGELVTVNITAAPLARMLGESSNSEIVVAALNSVFGGTWRLAVQSGPVDASSTTGPTDAAEPPPDDEDEPEPAPAVSASSAAAAPAQATPAAVPAPPARSAAPATSVAGAPVRRQRPARRHAVPPATPVPPVTIPRPPTPRPVQERDKRPSGPVVRSAEADPRDDTEPEDPESAAAKSDPEADALKLLESTLGARPIDS